MSELYDTDDGAAKMCLVEGCPDTQDGTKPLRVPEVCPVTLAELLSEPED